MAGLVIGYLNVWIIPVIKIGESRADLPGRNGRQVIFIGKTQFYPGKSTTCLTNSAPLARVPEALPTSLRTAKLAHSG